MKCAIKILGRCVGLVFAAPHLLGYVLARPVLGRQRAFASASEAIARIPGQRGVYARQTFYRALCDHVGRDVYFGFMSLLSKPDARLGDRVYIGRFCTLGRVTLGEETMLADGVQVLSGRHHHGGAAGVQRDTVQLQRITVGSRAWLGANAVVMADVGDDAIVGAGAVVTRPVPVGATVGGIPARPLTAACAA